MCKELGKSFANVTKEQVSTFLSMCEICQLKNTPNHLKHRTFRIRQKHTETSEKQQETVTRTIISDRFNARAQIYLIDFQSHPDGEYRFILNYQENLSKFCILRPLKTNTTAEVSNQLVDIFCLFGVPSVIHTDNGPELETNVLLKLMSKQINTKF